MSKVFTWILMFGNLIICKICTATINQNTWLNRTLISHLLSVEENKAKMGMIKDLQGFFPCIYESEGLHSMMRKHRQWSVTFTHNMCLCL